VTRLRDTLDGIADEAPPVDFSHLAERAVAGHRRRRYVMTAVAALATAAVVSAGAIIVTLPGVTGHRAATSHQGTGAGAAPDLPDGKVGSLSHAYRTPCVIDKGGRRIEPADCSAVEWRVVTRAGTTYRVPQALPRTERDDTGVPVAISRDGRMLAYYSRQDRAFAVRDLGSGSVVTSTVTVEEKDIGVGAMLVVSDDGRHVIFDSREGSKWPGVLIDMRTGRKSVLDGRYEPVSIKNGVAELIRYVKTDLWLMPVGGGGRPVRFEGTFIQPSEVAPDGRTVAAVRWRRPVKNQMKQVPALTLLDTRTGQVVRQVRIRGLPADADIENTSVWVSGHEVTVVVGGKGGISTHAVDVRSGRARHLTRYPGVSRKVVLPGMAAIG
jgi:hypothetical protein